MIRACPNYFSVQGGRFRVDWLYIFVKEKSLLNIAANQTLERIVPEPGDWDSLNLRYPFQAHLCAAFQALHHILDHEANRSLSTAMGAQIDVNSIIHTISFGVARVYGFPARLVNISIVSIVPPNANQQSH